MNLLGSASYDPAVAVSKATSALLAMTAVDTTNLRLAITVPAHGKVKFIMAATVVGATTLPGILLGVLNGATVLKRAAPQMFSGTQDRATEMATAYAEFTVTGLTPGAMNVDAAYAVQVIVALTNIKFGGPNDATGADAWGAFVFEAWDPQPIPTVAPGAAGGLTIAGANAATTFATLTSTGAFSVNGVSAVSQTGDTFARQGAPVGASASADTAAVKADTAAALTRIPAALTAGGNIKADALALGGTVQTGRDIGASVLLSAGAGAGQLDFTAGVVKSNLAQILGTALTETAGLLAGGFKQFFNIASPTSTMNTLTTVTTATTATNLTNAPTAGDFTAAMKTSLNAATPAVTVSDKTGFSLSAAGVQAIWDALTSALTTVGSVGKRIGDNLDALISSRASPTNITAGVITTVTNLTNAPTAGDFTATMKTSLNAATPAVTVSDKTGFSLSTAGIKAIWDQLTSALTTVGSVGKLLVDDLDAAISSRLATAGYTAPPSAATNAAAVFNEATAGHTTAGTYGKLLTDDNANITSIKAKTDNLPPDPADASDVAAAFTIVNGAIAGLNNISPAGVRAALGLAIANLDTQLDALPTNAELTTALVGPLAADVKKVNGVTVTGNGQTGTEWGPA